MKWKNIDVGPAYYYITGTLTEWLPLLKRAGIRELVCAQIKYALAECGGSLAAFVIMPDHIHLLVYLPEANLLHKFNKLWRGRSGYKIIKLLKANAEPGILEVMASHANGKANYAAWKEQPRALAIWNKKKLDAMIDYIHYNPVRRGLVALPEEWPYSSYRFYERGETVALEVVPPEL